MTKREEENLINYIKQWFKDNKVIRKNDLRDKFIDVQNSKRFFFNEISIQELVETAKKAGYEITQKVAKIAYTVEVPKEKYIPVISKEKLELIYITQRMTVTEIANKHDISRDQVYYMLQYYGIKPKDRKPCTKEEIEEIYKKHGVPGGCKILKISTKTFYKLIDEYGIEKKYKKRKGVA